MFDKNTFMKAKFKPRERELELTALTHFFPEGELPLWKVRGLSADELAISNSATITNQGIDALVAALAGSDVKDKAEALRETLGLPTEEVQGETAKRIELLLLGSVDPVVDRATVVKLGQYFPIEFMLLTNAITTLTGQGADLVK